VFVRIGVACAVVVGVCVSQLTSTSGADTSFNEGTASAEAQAISVAPTTGQLNYAIILATSAADYENSEGQALSQTLDLGAIGTSLEAPSCSNGAPSNIQASDFPAPIQAESTNGNQTLNSTAADSLNGTSAGVGVETASATTTPTSSSTTTIASDNLANEVSVLGATSSAQSGVENGATRSAEAAADISSVSLANGLVVLKGLHWEAQQTSGASSTSTGTFAISGLTVAGTNVPVSNDDAATILQVVNSALSEVGLQVDWPTQTTLSDGEVEISPLIVGIDNNALGQEVVGSNLGATASVRNVLQQELLAVNCNFATALTLADIGIGPFAGGGNLNIELGGANANTTDETFASPFGSISLSPTTASNSFASALPSSTSLAGGIGFTGASGTGSTAGTTPTAGTSGKAQKESLGPIQKTVFCRSTSPAGGGCNSDGALPAGLIGVSLLGGLAAWEIARRNRLTRRSAREEQ
jgi:hypothetical protein